MVPAPAAGKVLRIRRLTPTDEPLVDFPSGAVVAEANLDIMARQAIFAAEDAADTGTIAAAAVREDAKAFRLWTAAGFANWIKDALLAVLPATFKGDKGDQGDDSTVPGPPGPAPDLTIGNVTNVATGGAATAGLRPNGEGAYFLDLGLPIGATGSGSSVAWGGVTGALADQTDLVAALGGKADAAHSHSFASLTGKPTTLVGYGITDAVASAAFTFANLGGKPTTLAGYGIIDAAASGHSHTFASLTSKPTTLVGYGITDAANSSHNHDATYAKKATVSTSAPSGGSNGDVWYKV